MPAHKPPAKPAVKAAGNCGTGAGGFKAGNDCGCHGDHLSPPKTQAHPAVQRAHHRIRKSRRRESDSHADNVAYILAGKDYKGLVARGNPKAKEDADALRDYEPARGHVAIGHLPGRPTETQALQTSALVRRQKKGDTLTDAQLNRIADRDVSHVGVRDGWDDSDIAGHRYLVHNRLTGENYVHSDADLQAMAPSTRARMVHDEKNPGQHVLLRQFDSQGVEVPLDHSRYNQRLDPEVESRSRSSFKQFPKEHARERAAFKGTRRAQFGTSDPKP